MPQLDMPMDRLLTYGGRTPKPTDFDAYWARGLAEIAAIDPQVELVPADVQPAGAECFYLTFTSTFGARVTAKYLRPKNAQPGKHPLLLMFHGFTGNSGDFFDKLGWVAQGYSVVALDCRGQGGRSQDHGTLRTSPPNGHLTRGLSDANPDHLLYRQLYLDTAMLARVAMAFPEVDRNRVGATGGSQGGGLTLACAGLVPQVKVAVAVFPFLCDWQRVWEMDLAKDAYQELRDYFRRFDPLHEREVEIFTRLGYIDCQFLAARIKAEVLMPVGLMDGICPPSTQFAAYNKITSTKSLIVYPDFGHESLPALNDAIAKFFFARL